MNEPILFKETQRFKMIWLWLVLIAVNLIFVIGFVQQIIFHHPFGDKPIGNTGLIICMLSCMCVSALLLSSTLHTVVTASGIGVKFSPWQWCYKFFAKQNIQNYYARTYNPLSEYGGWGYRKGGKKYGDAYNMNGNQGLQLEMKDGKKILIGSKQPQLLVKSLELAAT